VQVSAAYLKALKAIQHRFYSGFYPDTLIPRGIVDAFCSLMKVVPADVIAPLGVVQFLIRSQEAQHAVFGVGPDGIVLLNAVRNGDFTNELDVRVWNQFVHSNPRLPPLTDKEQASRYACFFLGLANEVYASDTLCGGGTVVEAIDRVTYRVTMTRWQRAVRVRRNYTVLDNPALH